MERLAWSHWLLGAWIVLTTTLGTAAAADLRSGHPSGRGHAVTIPAATGIASAPAPGNGAVAAPIAVEAPRVGLSAPLVPVGKEADGAMEVPDFGTAGWYEPGARPGQPGAAVLAGHVDSYEGPDVFFRLRDLVPGDEVIVHRADGSVARFVVDQVEQVSKQHLPVDRIWGSTTKPELRLITCGGEFDESARSYRANVIVYARAAT